DFATTAFEGLWGTDPASGQGRQDLGQFKSTGYNLVRLFNWDPSLGTTVAKDTDPSDRQAHMAFLDAAYNDGMQVMVPVSNYFLSNDQFAWNNNDPSTSFAYNDPNVPDLIRTALQNFLASITQPANDPNNPTGAARINPAVQ